MNEKRVTFDEEKTEKRVTFDDESDDNSMNDEDLLVEKIRYSRRFQEKELTILNDFVYI